MTREMDSIDKIVGANLLKFRIAREITQEQLGDAIGVTFQQIQKYEKGTNALSSTRIPQICKTLGIEPNDLFEGLMDGAKPKPLGISNAALAFATTISEYDGKKMAALRKVAKAIA